jgi:hypothetical protein
MNGVSRMITTQVQGLEGHQSLEHRSHCHVEIRIDHKPYTAPKNPMTGMELRALAKPAIGPEYDLWLENPGPEDDIKVGASQEIFLRSGMHFYIAPATINPGGHDGAA